MAARLWPRAWVYWLAGCVGSFLILEDAGYRRHKHKTLSRVMGRWLSQLGRSVARNLGLGPDDRLRWIGAAIFALSWGALSVHFWLIDADQEAGVNARPLQEVPSCPSSSPAHSG